YIHRRPHATLRAAVTRARTCSVRLPARRINCDINLDAKDVGQQPGRENNDCRVRYKSLVVALGETFNPEESETRSPTTKPASNAIICIYVGDCAASRTRKLRPGHRSCAAATLMSILFNYTFYVDFYF
ncbi:hypothetical protein X777_00476, partial [Ooceraea biroi]